MAAYDPRPIRLITIHQNTAIHTAKRGVPVLMLILVQMLEKGSSLSREKANTVRPSDCYSLLVIIYS
jgi:hypothetical protein